MIERETVERAIRFYEDSPTGQYDNEGVEALRVYLAWLDAPVGEVVLSNVVDHAGTQAIDVDVPPGHPRIEFGSRVRIVVEGEPK